MITNITFKKIKIHESLRETLSKKKYDCSSIHIREVSNEKI